MHALTDEKIKEIEPNLSNNSINYNFNFFTLSTTKLILMSICTFGLYEYYWFYKNWVAIRDAGNKCSPFWRAFFAPFFAYSCFKHIQRSSKQNNISSVFAPGIFAVSYFILSGLWRLPDPYWLISTLSFLPLISANSLALSVNKTQNPNFTNSRFTKWDWALLIFGNILFLLCVFVSFTPDV